VPLPEDLDYSLEANLTDFGVDKVFKGQRLEGATVKAFASPAGIVLRGEGKLAGAPLAFEYEKKKDAANRKGFADYLAALPEMDEQYIKENIINAQPLLNWDDRDDVYAKLDEALTKDDPKSWLLGTEAYGWRVSNDLSQRRRAQVVQAAIGLLEFSPAGSMGIISNSLRGLLDRDFFAMEDVASMRLGDRSALVQVWQNMPKNARNVDLPDYVSSNPSMAQLEMIMSDVYSFAMGMGIMSTTQLTEAISQLAGSGGLTADENDVTVAQRTLMEQILVQNGMSTKGTTVDAMQTAISDILRSLPPMGTTDTTDTTDTTVLALRRIGLTEDRLPRIRITWLAKTPTERTAFIDAYRAAAEASGHPMSRVEMEILLGVSTAPTGTDDTVLALRRIGLTESQLPGIRDRWLAKTADERTAFIDGYRAEAEVFGHPMSRVEMEILLGVSFPRFYAAVGGTLGEDINNIEAMVASGPATRLDNDLTWVYKDAAGHVVLETHKTNVTATAPTGTTDDTGTTTERPVTELTLTDLGLTQSNLTGLPEVWAGMTVTQRNAVLDDNITRAINAGFAAPARADIERLLGLTATTTQPELSLADGLMAQAAGGSAFASYMAGMGIPAASETYNDFWLVVSRNDEAALLRLLNNGAMTLRIPSDVETALGGLSGVRVTGGNTGDFMAVSRLEALVNSGSLGRFMVTALEGLGRITSATATHLKSLITAMAQ